MPCSFDAAYQSPASVSQIFSAFGDADYWRARIAAYDPGIALETLSADESGAVTVTTSQDLKGEAAPALLAKLYPRDLVIRRSETWTPIGPTRVTGAIEVTASGAPLAGAGSAELTAAADGGSRIAFHATLTFRVPVVGGRIERYLAGELATGLAELQDFTNAWIAEHG